MDRLLRDGATGRNIVFATSTYEEYGDVYRPSAPITQGALFGYAALEIKPRVLRSSETQGDRTRKRAEVFTPAWIVNKMNNYCDAEWFGRENVFNREDGTTWTATKSPVEFPEGKTWQDYVDSRRLEITCGEAPYIVSRYDAATGEEIPPKERVGLLDRKLRVVGENAADEAEWMKWARRAFESVYAYEYQGDSLLIARVNLLMTFCEYFRDKWHSPPTERDLSRIVTIIWRNFWQMDGLTGRIPYRVQTPADRQMALYEDFEELDDTDDDITNPEPCMIRNWRKGDLTPYTEIERSDNMKFDFVIGNAADIYGLTSENAVTARFVAA